MAEHCATCRFFGEPAPLYGKGRQVDDFHEEGDTVTTHHHCTLMMHANSGVLEIWRVAELPAVLSTSGGHTVQLRVLPTFGCVLHEPR